MQNLSLLNINHCIQLQWLGKIMMILNRQNIVLFVSDLIVQSYIHYIANSRVFQFSRF